MKKKVKLCDGFFLIYEEEIYEILLTEETAKRYEELKKRIELFHEKDYTDDEFINLLLDIVEKVIEKENIRC